MGAVDWDRRLFDALIPLPDGTSYNAYLVKGSEKTALLDTVDPSKADVLMSCLDDVKVIDYIVAHHAEQDHSGALPNVLAKYPQAKVITSPKGKPMLVEHVRIPEDRIITVNDGQTLSLGDKTLEFIHTPWVHWPETMSTYLHEDRVLFTCDLFGSHLAVSGIYEPDKQRVREASKRYYAEVMMPFRAVVKKHIERFEKYPVQIIAPSHGPVLSDPDFIIQCHLDWVSDRLANTVILPYVSMHGSTEIMVEHLSEALSARGIQAERHNLAVTDAGRFAMALVDAATMVIGSPTVLGGAHPKVISAVFLANALKPKMKFAAIIGSYGWGGRMPEQITATLANLKLEFLSPVVVKGKPTAGDLAALDALAAQIAARHKAEGIG